MPSIPRQVQVKPFMIVTFASAWSASNGGINAFNFELSRALAKSTKQPLFCAVTDPSLEEIALAEKDGVTLIKVKATPDGKPSPDCADNIIEALSGGNGTVQLWVGHDLISGDAAVRAASTHGGRLALVHHMDYLSYQNISGDRGDHTYDNYERQMKLFRTEEATLFGVGSWLTDNASRLGNRRAHCLVPGFPNISGSQHRVSTDRLMVVSAGRFDEKAEPLKQISSALDGFALALRHSTSFPMLQSATMSILGVDGTEDQKALHARAEELAGRPVNIVPAGFRNDPTAVARLASTSHLVVVPSRHEGFGLVGWEAIGTETPLIIGSNTGLAHLLRKTLDGREAGLVSIVKFDGSDQDRERISEAIQNVARDLSTALRRASTLREL